MIRQIWKSGFLILLVSWPLSSVTSGVQGATYPSREEVLQEVYGSAVIAAERVFLTSAEQSTAAEKAGVDIPSPLIARYVLKKDQAVVGRAYVDTHIVRTKKQSVLICLAADGAIKRIEVTAFLEPPEYLVPDVWYQQYEGRMLSEDLRLQRDIRSVAGATLTSMTTAAAVRRVLAIDEVLEKKSTGGSR
ncbi:MAG: FMN-binding protein [Acidobacteriota bacterium]|nr:MAG: FMN-binding protein [Acidobacteriota bacterium]